MNLHPKMNWASWMLASVVLVTLVGCGGVAPLADVAGASGPAVEAPSLKVGDRWVYRGKDGYRQTIVWEETHEVVAIGAEGISVRVTAKGPSVDTQRTEIWSAPGIVRVGAVSEFESDRFDPQLIRYQFPMTTGQTWRQQMTDLNKPPSPFGKIQRNVTVGGYESVATPAGTFNAIKLRIFMQLDDGTVWRYPTECNYLVWYAPAVGAMVMQNQRSYYREKEGMEGSTVPGQNATVELVSYTRGAR
jgi:hypothetical protein